MSRSTWRCGSPANPASVPAVRGGVWPVQPAPPRTHYLTHYVVRWRRNPHGNARHGFMFRDSRMFATLHGAQCRAAGEIPGGQSWCALLSRNHVRREPESVAQEHSGRRGRNAQASGLVRLPRVPGDPTEEPSGTMPITSTACRRRTAARSVRGSAWPLSTAGLRPMLRASRVVPLPGRPQLGAG